MTLEIDFVATHEAGHAVMQWLVGWEPGEVEVTTDDQNGVTHAITQNSHPTSYTLSNFRKRLLVVFGGVSATRGRWPGQKNDQYDWQNAGAALYLFLNRKITTVGGDFRNFQDEEANNLCKEAIEICEKIVDHQLLQSAIGQMAQVLVSLKPDNDSKRRLKSSETVSICEDYIGNEFQAKNQWSDWIEGQ